MSLLVVPMRVIGGIVIAIAVIFGTISFASATYENIQTEHQVNKDYQLTESLVNSIPFVMNANTLLIEDRNTLLIEDRSELESKVNSSDVKIVYEIVLIPHPCDPLSNSLFLPNDPIVNCATDFVDLATIDFISDIAIEVLGFPITMDDLAFTEVTNLNDLQDQILEFENTSELIFEHEMEDLTKTTSQFNEEMTNSDPDLTKDLDKELEEQLMRIRGGYQNIKDKWKEEIKELQNNAQGLFNENPGMKSNILKQDIEKLIIRFDLKEEKLKNTEEVQKKIKTAIELHNLKKEFQDSMTEYAITEKVMKYGTEKDAKLEQLKDKNTKIMTKMLIAEAKHNDKKIDLDDFKKIAEVMADEISTLHGGNSGKANNADDEIVEGTNGGNSSEGSDSDNPDKGNSSGKSSSGKGSSGKGSGKGKD